MFDKSSRYLLKLQPFSMKLLLCISITLPQKDTQYGNRKRKFGTNETVILEDTASDSWSLVLTSA